MPVSVSTTFPIADNANASAFLGEDDRKEGKIATIALVLGAALGLAYGEFNARTARQVFRDAGLERLVDALAEIKILHARGKQATLLGPRIRDVRDPRSIKTRDIHVLLL